MSIIRIGKRIISSKPKLLHLVLTILNYCPFNNKFIIHGSNNNLEIKNAYLFKCKIIVKGTNNKIIIDDDCTLWHSKITIYGNNSTVIINKSVTVNYGDFWIEDNKNNISIGENTTICGKTHLACIEGTNITIGKNCLFSSGIVFRTGDSHSILNENGKRINPSKDIEIKNHVWIGSKVTVNKGVVIQENSVVGTNTLVTKPIEEANVIIAGVPAKIIKNNINWDANRIPIENEAELI